MAAGTSTGLDVRLVIPGHGAPFTDIAGALDRAFRRLDYLAADPAHNAQNGIKVLVKFRLLERRRITLAELRQWMREVPLLVESNRNHLRMDPDALAGGAVAGRDHVPMLRRLTARTAKRAYDPDVDPSAAWTFAQLTRSWETASPPLTGVTDVIGPSTRSASHEIT